MIKSMLKMTYLKVKISICKDIKQGLSSEASSDFFCED